MSKKIKKSILLFLAILSCSSALAAELEKMKIDAAKRATCSVTNPCFINIRGHKDAYVVKVNSASINENGVININHYKYKRFVYNGNGKLLREIDNEK